MNIHVSLAAEPVFHIGFFPVSNALINAWIALVFFFVVGLIIRFSVKQKPGRFQLAVEMLLEGLLKFFDQVTHDREKSKRFLPIAGTLFLFILFSNWLGLLPGTGSIMVGHAPLLRPANSDLNLTIAMAITAVVATHVMGMIQLGFFTHVNKFIQLGTIWKALKTLKPVAILTALVEFIVGIIEIFSEFAKIASLSLRLFGNIFAGEVLITVIGSLIAFLVPLPFMAMELLVGIVQATVFATLTLVYLTLQTSAPHGSHDPVKSHSDHGAGDIKHEKGLHLVGGGVPIHS